MRVFSQGSFQAPFSEEAPFKDAFLDEALFKNLALRGFSLSALPRDFQSLCATGPQLYPTRTCALLRLRACACACACLRACARPFSCACVLAHLCALARLLRGIFTCTYAPTDPRPRETRLARRRGSSSDKSRAASLRTGGRGPGTSSAPRLPQPGTPLAHEHALFCANNLTARSTATRATSTATTPTPFTTLCRERQYAARHPPTRLLRHGLQRHSAADSWAPV